MLSDKIAYYEETKLSLKNTPAQYKSEFTFLKEVDSLALANEQMHLQTAYKNFFRNPKTGFPKFKSKKFDRKSYTTNNVNNSIRIVSQDHIQLPKLGIVKLVEHRRIPDDHIIKSVTISQCTSGKYYISILTEYDYEIPNCEINLEKSIGLDYSTPEFYVDSQGRKPEGSEFVFSKNLKSKERNLSKLINGHRLLQFALTVEHIIKIL